MKCFRGYMQSTEFDFESTTSTLHTLQQHARNLWWLCVVVVSLVAVCCSAVVCLFVCVCCHKWLDWQLNSWLHGSQCDVSEADSRQLRYERATRSKLHTFMLSIAVVVIVCVPADTRTLILTTYMAIHMHTSDIRSTLKHRRRHQHLEHSFRSVSVEEERKKRRRDRLE